MEIFFFFFFTKLITNSGSLVDIDLLHVLSLLKLVLVICVSVGTSHIICSI